MCAIYKRKVSSGPFLKKGTDIKDSDLITIANEGKQQEGEFGIQNIFLVKLADGREGNVSFNQTSVNSLIEGFGEESRDWIGKQVKVHRIKQNVAGKFIDVWYFAHPDAELTESGFVLPGKIREIRDGEIPVIESEDSEEINTENIPF